MIILRKMIMENKIKIRKIIGLSAGAFMAVFIASCLPTKSIRNLHDFALINRKKHSIDNILLKACWEIYPENIHELINGKIKILISKATYTKTEEVYIDKFESKLHLMLVQHASCFIPLITSNNIKGININGHTYFDGGFVNYSPIIKNNDKSQLVFYTHDVDYKYSFNFKDTCIELIILKGAIEFEKFIKQLMNNKSDIKNIPIKWINKSDILVENTLSDKISNNNSIKNNKKFIMVLYKYINILSKYKENDKYIYQFLLIIIFTITQLYDNIKNLTLFRK